MEISSYNIPGFLPKDTLDVIPVYPPYYKSRYLYMFILCMLGKRVKPACIVSKNYTFP